MKRYLCKMAWLTGGLVMTCLLFAFLMVYAFYFTAFVIFCCIVGEAWYIFHHMENNSRTLMQFIWSVRYTDFLTSYTKGGKESDISPGLAEAMDEALGEYKKQLQQKESQLQYFRALADHIDLSIIVYAPSGEIEWINRAARMQTGLNDPVILDDLARFQPDLPERLRTLQPGDLSILPVKRGQESYQLVLSGMAFVVLGRPLTVVSMKNIRTILEDKELEAWQKLIRVLTHEIMNSMTPIVSLSGLLKEKFQLDMLPEGDEWGETIQAVSTIHKRSDGLLRFVENYRKVTGIPAPAMQVILVNDLLAEAGLLYKNHLPELTVIYPAVNLQIIADKNQIMQVLINLIKNAFEAVNEQEDPVVKLSAGIHPDGQTYIQVSDNGPGIPPAVLERIFIPFFTTKSSGSGIGLSISRQIMHMHRGFLVVNSEEAEKTSFSLLFC